MVRAAMPGKRQSNIGIHAVICRQVNIIKVTLRIMDPVWYNVSQQLLGHGCRIVIAAGSSRARSSKSKLKSVGHNYWIIRHSKHSFESDSFLADGLIITLLLMQLLRDFCHQRLLPLLLLLLGRFAHGAYRSHICLLKSQLVISQRNAIMIKVNGERRNDSRCVVVVIGVLD